MSRSTHDPRAAAQDPACHGEVILALDRVRDLFAPPALDEFGGSADVASGIERLLVQLLAVPPEDARQVSIVVPAAELTPGVEDRMRAAVRRYCELKLADLEHRRATLRHDGWTALLLAAPLLVVTLLLIGIVSHLGLPRYWDAVLSDGLLLVLAWVVVWYPLDTLLWYGRPLAHEIRVVRALRDLDVVVRSDAAEEVGAEDGRAAPGDADLVRAAERAVTSRAGVAPDAGRRGAGRLRLGGPGRPRAGR
jgi:hypothetical protein